MLHPYGPCVPRSHKRVLSRTSRQRTTRYFLELALSHNALDAKTTQIKMVDTLKAIEDAWFPVETVTVGHQNVLLQSSIIKDTLRLTFLSEEFLQHPAMRNAMSDLIRPATLYDVFYRLIRNRISLRGFLRAIYGHDS